MLCVVYIIEMIKIPKYIFYKYLLTDTFFQLFSLLMFDVSECDLLKYLQYLIIYSIVRCLMTVLDFFT